MATYVVLFNLTAEGAKAAKTAPQAIEQAHEMIAKMGGKVVCCYVLMGEYDFLGVYELPSDEAAMMYAMGMASSGMVRTQTIKAFPYQDLGKLVGKMP